MCQYIILMLASAWPIVKFSYSVGRPHFFQRRGTSPTWVRHKLVLEIKTRTPDSECYAVHFTTPSHLDGVSEWWS